MSDPLLEQIYEAGVKDERKKWEDRIEQMIAEIEKLKEEPSHCHHFERGIRYSLEIIHKYTKEQDNERV